MTTLKSVLLLLLLVTAIPCSAKYYQVVYLTPTTADTKLEGRYLVFENDSVKVVYNFWSGRGVMSFMFYNKTDIPLYIDWKKSAFISQNRRLSYYQDKTTSSFKVGSTSAGFSFGSAFQNYFSEFGTSSRITFGTETIVHEERVTFVPPKAYIFKAFGHLSPKSLFRLGKKSLPQKTVNDVDVYELAPVEKYPFRNYITYSSSEEISSPQYIDNGFQIKKILTMKKRDFTERDDETFEKYSPWWSPTRYYLPDIKEYELFESAYE